ncbi:hypothetical protein GWN26_12280 [Candidatus Saccharibacteria bacterium]|nr:hypothetical protein [Calditrichia bacterium]NIV72706.1 hypothetical protein [Calditrichia bacterium]NIV99853.1 hypothetical protein [Candidatus Saccharibacteria bacterium]NIW80777.1 hypothetical protein [Calditrichia bacterium]
MSNNQPIPAELLKQVYINCSNYSLSIIGEKKSKSLLHASRQTILPYFPNLESLQLDGKGQLQINTKEIGERELLAFVVWIQQFIRELKTFLVGIGHLDIQMLTSDIKEQLEKIGFYEYYRQAQELEY